MSKLGRYHLLISRVQSELGYKHNLGSDALSVKHNQMLIDKGYAAWVVLTEDLMSMTGLTVQQRNCRISNMLSVISAYNISIVLGILKETYDILLSHISGKDTLADYSDFKGRFSEDNVALLGKLFSPIKESLNTVITSQTFVSRGVYLVSCKSEMYRCAQYLQFLTKLNFSEVGLEAKALCDYKLCEDELLVLDHSNYMSYLPALQRIIHNWMIDWNYDGYAPNHGSGSVADTDRSKLSKYYALSSDTLVDYLYQQEADGMMPFWHRQSFQRCSKLVFVPKNITKLRSISMEPATLQYFQQGCMKSLYKYFATNVHLKKILKLSDQGQNQMFAYHSSITNDYATIDLSHASDSVDWKFVKAVFARTPKLLKWLLCTRSTSTLLPTGEQVKLNKFAPMGSALCFPVESLIFAAIAKLSTLIAREQGLDLDVKTGIHSNMNYLTVYGDDIILPVYAADICITILKKCGFTPNESKSYLTGPFKESCGVNFFGGYDITAIKFNPDYCCDYANCISPAAYTALCDYANTAYDKGLSLFRLHCIHELLNGGIMPLFTNQHDISPAIFSKQPTNFHLKRKYNKHLQKHQYIYTSVKARSLPYTQESHIDEDVFYFDKLLLMSKSGVNPSNKYLPFNALAHHTLDKKRSDGLAIGPGTINIEFDIACRYNRDTLLQSESVFCTCFSDVI